MNRENFPAVLEGYGTIRLYRASMSERVGSKLLADLEAAFDACDLRDGATLSFHHHLRNGDAVLNMVLAVAERRGLKDLHVAASSIFPVHEPLVGHIERGTVTGVSAGFISGPVAEAISVGALPRPAILRTHGGRARAIAAGELPIDVAFVAAPAADPLGNISGSIGPRACGALGYPKADIVKARLVVAVTDTLVPFPVPQIEIDQQSIDWVVPVKSIGDAAGILSGITRPTTEPIGLEIARRTAAVIEASRLLIPGFSLQNGAGGISIATADELARYMTKAGIKGSFAAGGITGFHVKVLEAELFEALLDVQCFDLAAVQSYASNPRHLGMSASVYACPGPRGAVVDLLDTVVLGATEIDLDFNVNVTTRSDGMINGGSGGQADTAAGAKLTIITTRLTAAGFAKVVDRVGTVTTPGETVDVLVTEAGIAVNPRRGDLVERLGHAGLPLRNIADLQRDAAAVATRAAIHPADGRIVAVSEYRDGSVTDVIKEVPRRD
jgi:citrate lyase subunit alpha/citrate CoA-transferase